MIGGRVDAILGGFRNIEGVDLQQRGLDPRIVPVDQLGVPTYDELVLVARKSTVDAHPAAIRAFIEALGRGTDYARATSAGGGQRSAFRGQGSGPDADASRGRRHAPAAGPPQGKPYGYLDPAAGGPTPDGWRTTT